MRCQFMSDSLVFTFDIICKLAKGLVHCFTELTKFEQILWEKW